MSDHDHKSRPDPTSHFEHLGSAHGEEGESWLISYADLMTLLVGFFVILMSFSSMDQEKFEEVKKSVSKEFGGKYENSYEKISEQIKNAIQKSGLNDQIGITTTDGGVSISFLGAVFFATGSTDFKPEAKKILDELLVIFKSEAGDYSYVIEGHTDDVPLSAGGFLKNNWELSSIRACRVLEYFLINGFQKSQLLAIGYGETQPLLPNRNESGIAIPENQSQNRRVVIRMAKKDKL